MNKFNNNKKMQLYLVISPFSLILQCHEQCVAENAVKITLVKNITKQSSLNLMNVCIQLIYGLIIQNYHMDYKHFKGTQLS